MVKESTLHAISLSLAWTILIDYSIIIIRYRRGKPLSRSYLKLHQYAITLALILSFYGLIVYALTRGLRLSKKQGATAFQLLLRDIHVIIGYFFFVVPLIVSYIGLKAKNHIESKFERQFNLLKNSRKWVTKLGWALIIGAKFNIFIAGYFWRSSTWFPLTLFVYCIEALIFGYFEYKRRLTLNQGTDNIKRNHILTNSKRNNSAALESNLMEALNSGIKSREELIREFNDISWVIYGNKVYNLDTFVHPGGNFLIQQVKGREISRFLHGAHALEIADNSKPYQHTRQAYEILEQFYIGTLQKHTDSLIPFSPKKQSEQLDDDLSQPLNRSRSDSQPLVVDLDNKYEDTSFHTWEIIEKVKLQNNQNLYRLDLINQNNSLQSYLVNPRSFGRHVLVRFDDIINLVRPYSLCYALDQQNQAYLGHVLEFFNSYMSGQQPIGEEPYHRSSITHSLSLYIREMGCQDGLSKKIATLPTIDSKIVDKRYAKLYGPMGVGLDLNEKSKGTLYIICVGTGILPFLDLIWFMLLKTVYNILREHHNEEIANKIKLRKMEFDGVLDDFKIVLVSGCKNISLGQDIIQSLAEICDRYQKDTFKVSMASNFLLPNYVQDIGTQKIDQQLLEKIIKIEKKSQEQKFCICGTPQFNKDVYYDLLNLGVNNSKIYFV